MASSYEISVESDARDGDSYKLRVSRDGRTWNAVKDQAQLDAFPRPRHAPRRDERRPFSHKPSELEAYLSDVARHASSSEKEQLVSSFLEGRRRAGRRAGVPRGTGRRKMPRLVHNFVDRAPGTPSTRRSSHESVAAMASPPSNHTPPPRGGDACNTTHESIEVDRVTQRTNAGPDAAARSHEIADRFAAYGNKRRLDGRWRCSTRRATKLLERRATPSPERRRRSSRL